MPDVDKIFDKLPFWNREIAEKLKPLEPYASLVLIGFAALCILAAIYLKPEHKTLMATYLILP